MYDSFDNTYQVGYECTRTFLSSRGPVEPQSANREGLAIHQCIPLGHNEKGSANGAAGFSHMIPVHYCSTLATNIILVLTTEIELERAWICLALS